ncbi:hypothetical protein [Chachezhania sediminis]|uniref:hypothetical protein n=1 Tax=Chachezhania sediminis TaxID=2599291 RepID=UPI00131BF5D1|nr:hypothetical protein [Chachezhania sediminis]
MSIEALAGWLQSLSGSGAETGPLCLVGAGATGAAPRLLEAALGAGFSRILRLEPDPDERGAAPAPGIVLDPRALAPVSGAATLHVCNMTALSALAPATGLEPLFPGLKETARVPVETVGWSALLSGETGAPVLLAPSPGLAASAAAAVLAADDTAPLPVHMLLILPAIQAWQGLPSAETVIRDLEPAGYRVQARDGGDPDFPALHLYRDPMVAELARQAAETEATRQQLAAEAAEKIAAAEAARDEARTEAARSAEAVTAALAERDAARTAAQGDREAAAAEAKARARAEARLEACRAEIFKAEGQIALIRDLLLRGSDL